MYVSIANHLFHFIHFILAFTLLFIFYPRLIFKTEQETLFENVVSNFIRMVFIIIVIGYALVILKLFEFIGLFIVLLILTLYVSYSTMPPYILSKRVLESKALFFDYLDGIKNPKEDVIVYTQHRWKVLTDRIINSIHNKTKFWSTVVLTIVLIYSAYLRFYDAYIHAAPPMSDAYVTLEWMKYIIRRQLFYSGIYPQGFHVYLATLQKFSFIDPIYILKYCGPFNGVLTTIGMYFVVSRCTGRAFPGIIGAAIYGVLGAYLIEWERQASTNSQEFAFIFVLPTLYFFYRYIEKNEKKDKITAFCGLAVTGLVHTIAFSFAAIGVAVLAFSAIIINPCKYWRKIIEFINIGIMTGVISIIPIAIGLLIGKSFHSSSVDFLVATERIGLPTLRIVDYIGGVCILIAFLWILFKLKRIRERLVDVFIVLLSSFSFLFYYYGGYVTQSVVVETRFSSMWSLILPIIIGITFFLLLKSLKKSFIRFIVEISLSTALIGACLFYLKPQPSMPYKMEYDSNVEQYLRISSMLTPTEWLIVSQNEGYSLALGKGFHLLVKDFITLFDPEQKYLINKKTHSIYKMADIFIYQEKKVFTTDFENLKQEYARRKVDNIQLENWIQRYRKNHSNLTLFYEDENIKIYRIHQVFAEDQNENLKKIWGSE